MDTLIAPVRFAASLLPCWWWPLALCLAGTAVAADRAIEDVRGSRSDERVSAEIALGCPMRYLDHSPRGGGLVVRVRLELTPECEREFGGVHSEMFRPRGGYMGAFDVVEFDTAGLGEASVTVRFQRPVGFEVRQGALLNVLELLVDTTANVWLGPKSNSAPSRVAAARAEPTPPAAAEPAPEVPPPPPALPPAPVASVVEAPPIPPAPATVEVPPIPPAQAPPLPPSPVPVPAQPPMPKVAPQIAQERVEPRREPMRLVPEQRHETGYRFVINLDTVTNDTAIDFGGLQATAGRTLYTNDVQVGERVWKELRLGFFASEQQARATLDTLRADWPRAWVSVADADERARAVQQPLQPPARRAPVAALAAELTDPVMSTEVAGELMTEAKAALIDGNYTRSAELYRRVLAEAGPEHRPEARELLGVAYQKNGEQSLARAEYQAYLAEYPDDPQASRVRQRLAGLPDTAPVRERRSTEPSTEVAKAQWEFFGDVSQFYYRDVNQPRDDLDDVVSQSAVLSQANMVVERRGTRFDLLGRVNAGYYYDLLDETEGVGDQGLVSYAFLDISDHKLALEARIGRQSSYTGGILGRFDGMHLAWGWRPNITFNVTTGFPVDTPRQEFETGRFFYGASVDFANVWEYWDFSLFTNLQEIDGISDREAVGGEAQFRSENWNLVGLVDFDLSYSVLNSGLLIGNWRANDRLTLNARFDTGASPFLTTRNALIGQPVTSIDALRETYTEGQMRRLARNRTAQSQLASIGFSAGLTERFNLNSDIGYHEIEATPSTGGIPGTPGNGGQIYYTANLVGSSLMKARDTMILGLRYSTDDLATTSTLILDMRYPVRDSWRINPRIAVSTRENELENADQWIIAPTLRLLYRWFRGSRLELEVGGEWSDRDLPQDPLALPGDPVTEESSAYFMTLGYYMDF